MKRLLKLISCLLIPFMATSCSSTQTSSSIDMEEEFRKLSDDGRYLICSQWNVGQFGHGAIRSIINEENYNKMTPQWNKEVASHHASLCGLIEYNIMFGVDTNGKTVSPDQVVWNNYPYRVCYRQTYTYDWYGGNAINSKYLLTDTKKVEYSCFEGIVDPDEGTQKHIDESFYTLADMEYMGVKIKVVECSVPYNHSDLDDSTYQKLVYNELVNTFKEYPFVILMGDFELVNNEDYNIFTEGGFSLCNGGEHGWFPTCPDNCTLVKGVNALDNIIVKGFNVVNVRMSTSDLSDHYPLIAALEIE